MFAIVLFTATHWPQLKLPLGPVPRPDLLQHLVAFGLWAFLFVRCGWFGPWQGWRNIALGFLIAAVYAAVDEGLQAIPLINRVFGWDDLAFNTFGVWLGIIAALGVRQWNLNRAWQMRPGADQP